MPQTPSFIDNLNDSEKRYLKIAAIFFPLLILVICFYLYYRSISEVETNINNYKDSLKLVNILGPSYLAQQQSQEDSVNHKKLDDDVLKNNTIKLTSFVAGIASSIDLPIATYDENDVPYDTGSGGDKGKIVIERTLSFEIREAELSKIVALMERIEESDKPVYVKHYTISKYGSKPGLVRAKIVVATFLTSEKAS